MSKTDVLQRIDKDVRGWGLIVGGEYDDKPNYYYAEVMPSGGKWYRQFLPSVRRWWFEIHELEAVPTDDMGIGSITHAYESYGSGGSYTLRGCIIKAMAACEEAANLPTPPGEPGGEK